LLYFQHLELLLLRLLHNQLEKQIYLLLHLHHLLLDQVYFLLLLLLLLRHHYILD
jgi:hypothetical protein